MRPLLTDRQRAIVLLGLSLAALLLRLLGLGRLPLWTDEQASLIESQGISMTDPAPAGQIIQAASLRATEPAQVLARAAEFDLPAYVAGLGLWTKLAGVSELAIRLPSALLGAACIPLIFYVGVRTIGARAGLIAAALFAVAPSHLIYSQEARVYAAGTFLCLLSCLLLLRAQGRGAGAWMAYGASAALLPIAHLMATPILLAHGLWLMATRAPPRRVLEAALVAVLLLTLVIPLGVGVSIFTTHISTGVAYQNPPPELRNWARPATFTNLAAGLAYMETILFGIDSEALGLRARHGAALTLVMLGLMLRGASRMQGASRLLVVTGLLVCPVFATLVSAAYGHVVALQWKYAIWSLIFVALLLAKGLEALPGRRVWALLVFATWAVSSAAALSHPLWRDALRFSDARAIAASVGSQGTVRFRDVDTLRLYAAMVPEAGRLFLGDPATLPAGDEPVVAVDVGEACFERGRPASASPLPLCLRAH